MPFIGPCRRAQQLPFPRDPHLIPAHSLPPVRALLSLRGLQWVRGGGGWGYTLAFGGSAAPPPNVPEALDALLVFSGC